jgi:hypothetical protein
MATLRRGLVDKVKKAAAKVSTRGVQVAAKAGTRGARALVETTAAAVKTVDKIQATLGRRSRKSAASTQQPMVAKDTSGAGTQSMQATVKPMGNQDTSTQAPAASAKPVGTATKARRTPTSRTSEAAPVELRESGRKTMPAAAPKRSKQAKPAGPQFKVKRGQKHRHSGR